MHHSFRSPLWLLLLTVLPAPLGCFSNVLCAQDLPPLELGNPVGGGVRAGADLGDRRRDGAAGPAFFVVGRLERVQRQDSGATRFALLDDVGQIAAFIAPSPKYDLRQYLGQEVGVTSKNYSQSENAPPYVVIERLTPMDPAGVAAGGDALGWQVAGVEAGSAVGGDRQGAVSAGQIRAVNHVEFDASGNWSDAERIPSSLGVEDASGSWSAASCAACGDWGCATCSGGHVGGACHSPECNVCRPDPPTCGPPGWLWLRGEYLLWWAKGMATPPLVTTSVPGTAAGDAGVMGLSGTSVLYGDEEILKDGNSGFRIRFGGFFGPTRKLGYEGEYLGLNSNRDEFAISSDGSGSPILARPFFNINPRVGGDGNLNPPGGQDSELVAYPNLLAGSVEVGSFAEFRSVAGRLRYNICCKQHCGPYAGGCVPCGYPPFSRVDFLAGYRHFGLNEGLSIVEELRSLEASNPGTFDISDTFSTRNTFHGGEVGMAWEKGWRRWTLDMLMQIAIGATEQEVTIAGETTISPLVAVSETYEGGLLAQRSNIGTYTQRQFSMIPQLNTNLGFYMTPRMRALVGYSLIYWGGVVRPGDQIDLDINPDLLPPEIDPLAGPLRPEFVFRQSDYWIQGLNVGLDYRW